MISHVLPLAVALLPIVLADPVIDPVSLFQPYSGRESILVYRHGEDCTNAPGFFHFIEQRTQLTTCMFFPSIFHFLDALCTDAKLCVI